MSYVAPKIMGWQFNFRQMLAQADGVTYQLVDKKGVLYYKHIGLDIPKRLTVTGNEKFDNAVIQAYADWLFEKDVLS